MSSCTVIRMFSATSVVVGDLAPYQYLSSHMLLILIRFLMMSLKFHNLKAFVDFNLFPIVCDLSRDVHVFQSIKIKQQ